MSKPKYGIARDGITGERAKAAALERIALILKSHGFEIRSIAGYLGADRAINVQMVIGEPLSAEERADRLATEALSGEEGETLPHGHLR